MSDSVDAPRPSTPHAGPDNPWPGLTFFDERDAAYFQGREIEVAELLDIVSRERVTILFGGSGLGKTSLLRAGLTPRLRQLDILPVTVRLTFADDSLGLREQVQDAIARTTAAAGVEMPRVPAHDSLWETFYRRDSAFWDRSNRLVTPLLVFDQFEEVFTVGRRSAKTGTFLQELAALAEGRPMPAVAERLEASFEEFSRYSFSRQACKILLSLREDFLAELESVASGFRVVGSNRYRLLRMKGPSAIRVVSGANGALIQRETAESVVRFVAGASPGAALENLDVEPALLSVVCRELNETRRLRVLPTITDDMVSRSSTAILRNFYEHSFDGLDPAVRGFVEEKLVTASGFRNAVAFETALEAPGITRQSLDTLIQRRLLRVEHSDDTLRIELTHDVLTHQVKKSREERRQKESVLRQPASSVSSHEITVQGRADASIQRLVFWNRVLVVTVIVLLLMLVLLLARG
jgi:hypothetical protein